MPKIRRRTFLKGVAGGVGLAALSTPSFRLLEAAAAGKSKPQGAVHICGGELTQSRQHLGHPA